MCATSIEDDRSDVLFPMIFSRGQLSATNSSMGKPSLKPARPEVPAWLSVGVAVVELGSGPKQFCGAKGHVLDVFGRGLSEPKCPTPVVFGFVSSCDLRLWGPHDVRDRRDQILWAFPNLIYTFPKVPRGFSVFSVDQMFRFRAIVVASSAHRFTDDSRVPSCRRPMLHAVRGDPMTERRSQRKRRDAFVFSVPCVEQTGLWTD